MSKNDEGRASKAKRKLDLSVDDSPERKTRKKAANTAFSDN